MTAKRKAIHAAAVALGRRGGQVKSDAKAKSSRANGRKGGRPPIVTTTPVVVNPADQKVTS